MENTEVAESDQPANSPAWLHPAVVQMAIEATPPQTPKPSTQEPPAAAPPRPLHHLRKHKHTIAAGVAAGAIIIALLGSTVYLYSHSLVPVRIANLAPTHSVSDPKLASALTQAASTYKLTIKTPDGKLTSYTLADMGIRPDVSATLVNAEGQHGLAFWHTASVPLVLQTNQAKYIDFLRTHTAQASVAATDANITVTGGKTAITPESAGKGYRINDAPSTVLAVVGNLNPSPLVLTQGSISPYIKASSLQADRSQLDKILAQKIDITIGNDDIKPSASDIASWLTMTPDYTKGALTIAVNTAAVQKYFDDLTAPYVKSPADTVTPTGGDGTVTIVEQRGGGSIINESALVANLDDRLLSAQGQKLAVSITGNRSATVTAYVPDKWLLVNVTTKRMYAYQGSTLVRSFLISAGAAHTPTVQGTYKIYAKYFSQNMQGENADGTNYFQPNVPYVNYFYKDYAVHGNYWRPTSYFGNINSSHGCVGIQDGDAKWIYYWAPIGTTVMVHA